MPVLRGKAGLRRAQAPQCAQKPEKDELTYLVPPPPPPPLPPPLPEPEQQSGLAVTAALRCSEGIAAVAQKPIAVVAAAADVDTARADAADMAVETDAAVAPGPEEVVVRRGADS